MSESPLLDVRGLTVEFPRDDRSLRVADELDFQVREGEIVGLVGESGCGKSATATSLLRLTPHPGRIVAGQVLLEGRDLLALPEPELRRFRGAGLAYVPQEPAAALNPVLRVGAQLVDVVRAHRDVTKAEAWNQAVAALESVGIPDPQRRCREYPHQFSGGMKQRALIAMALVARPRVLLADEPTTALDVTLQAGVIDLLRRLVETGALGGILLITHDLGVVASCCDRVFVMYAGRIVEKASVRQLFDRPTHPYTQALISSLPSAETPRGELETIPGSVPDLSRLPAGCAFHPRCAVAEPSCSQQVPSLEQVGETSVACWVAQRESRGTP